VILVPDASATSGWVRVFVGLGANLGDRRATIDRALGWISDHGEMRVVRRSGIIETEPWGNVEQPRFLNAVAEVTTRLAPNDLLRELKRCEAVLGREPNPQQRWEPREIDLDILLYGDVVLASDELTIPHPHLTEREFVLRQLGELDPGLIHPGAGKLVSSYLRVT
jgi:2-amino-4-hydroxy-6-hydroxymethyldihydropteridine diphosphokinase